MLNIIVLFLAIFNFQTDTPTPTLTPTPTGAPYCELSATPFEDQGIFKKILFETPTPGPSLTPDGTLTPFPTSTQSPATPTLFPTNYYWANNKSIDITRYQHPTQAISYDDNFGNPCNGGYIVGVRYLYDQRSNGQNQGYQNNRTYNGGTTSQDRPATGDYGVSYNQNRSWLISSNVLPGVPTQIGSYNLSSASRPNTDLQLNNLYWKVYFPARALNISSNPLGYQRIHDVVVFCRGGNYDATPTPAIPQITPTYCKVPEDMVSSDPLATFEYDVLSQSCYQLIEPLNIDWSSMPTWITNIINGLGAEGLNNISFGGFEVCVTPYNINIQLLGVDIMWFITAMVGLVTLGLMVGEFRR